MSLKLFERVGGGAGAVSFHRGYVRLLNELPERHALAVEAVQGVTAVRHIAQHLLTSLPRLVWPQEDDSLVPTLPRANWRLRPKRA